VLDVYTRPYDKRRPVVGFDERPTQLIADVLVPVKPKPGRVKKVDYEYERKGTANLFGYVEPLTGKRDVWATDQRTKVEYAHALKRLVDAYPEAEVVVVVQDNLNTHTKAALYEAFPAEQAHRIANKLEFHFTPKHGSWLNVQELEWSALARQALAQRVGDRAKLERLVAHWLQERRERAVKIDWHFSTTDARVKLKRLYPILSA